jgi:hypothetical protein
VDLDDDILQAAKSLAAMQRRSLGKTLSDLVRAALNPSQPQQTRNGLRMLPVEESSTLVTPDLIQRLLDDDPS